MDISAIVIDLDGTLLHTAPELSEAANRMPVSYTHLTLPTIYSV